MNPIRINKEDVIKHNKHILAVSGGDFGIIDNSTLEFAVDSVNAETEPIEQASSFLFYAGNGHPFENGNKRTAFTIASGILASGAIVLTAPEQEIKEFVVGSVAQGKVSRDDVKEWLIKNTKPDKKGFSLDFNQTTSEIIIKKVDLLKELD